MAQFKGTLLLFGAAVVWGAAFVAQSVAADLVDTFTFNAVRNMVAVAVMTVIITVKERMQTRSARKNPMKSAALAPYDRKRMAMAGIACGLALFVADAFQQGGITIYPPEAAASGRSGFLTSTYVVMTAIATLVIARKLQISTALSVVVCVAGMYLLCLSGGIEGIYLGDVMSLIGAFWYTVHIFVIDRYTDLDSFRLSRMQFITAGTLATVCMLVFEHPEVGAIMAAALPILYAGMISSCVGYTLQMVGQKYCDPAVGAVVMSLESVFAAFAGWLCLNEILLPQEAFGCVLVFAAVIIAQLPGIAKSVKVRRRAKEQLKG